MVIKAKEVKKEENGMHIEGMITKDEAATQLRYILSKTYNVSTVYYINECPTHIRDHIEAAKWIRLYGHTHLTNQSFVGLIADIVGHTVSEEEALTARVLSGPLVALMNNKKIMMFITKEEKLELIRKYGLSQKPSYDEYINGIKITETVLGDHFQLNIE